MLSNSPLLSRLLNGLTRELTSDDFHRCDNPQCVMRQILLRDKQIEAKAVRSIPNTLTEEKTYILTGVSGSENWATIDDEGVRYVGALGMRKLPKPSDNDEFAFYVGDEKIEEYRQSLPEKDGRKKSHGDEAEPVKLTNETAFLAFFKSAPTEIEAGDVLQVRDGYYTGAMRHGRDWLVVATNNPGDDFTQEGEVTDLTIMIVDPNDGEVTFDRVSSVRYELAPVSDQFTAQAKAKASDILSTKAKVQGEQQ